MRDEHGFRIGIAEVQDALRALERAGIEEPSFRTALRTVFCGRREELARFDRVFDAFFLERTLLVREIEQVVDVSVVRAHNAARSPAAEWDAMLAKYSPAAGRGDPPSLQSEDTDAQRRAVRALVTGVRLGRSHKWRPAQRGERFDLPRTLRASLHTGGDPVRLRRLGHPRRNPRFVLLVDASRSMREHAPAILAFAQVLVRRTHRASVFAFSTELREITRELRRGTLPELGEAWGGGTRIGGALQTFLQRHGGILTDATMTLILSDGLDFGDSTVLAEAVDRFHRRCAAVVWVNPDAGAPDYRPATRGMRAILPFLTALISTVDLRDVPRALRAHEATRFLAKAGRSC